MRDLYKEAVLKGFEVWREQTGDHNTIMTNEALVELGPQAPAYWIARHAARETATVLLEVASNLGVTQEQWEALRVAAATIAYD